MVPGRQRVGPVSAPPRSPTRARTRFHLPLHPALAHLPIGAWICGFLFDVGSRLAGRPAALAEGAFWLIAVGVVSGLAAAAAGLADMRWIRPGSAAFRTASVHMVLNLSLIFAYAIDAAWRYRSHSYRAPASLGELAFSASCVLVLGVSGFLGGKLAYGHGVRVAGGSFPRNGE